MKLHHPHTKLVAVPAILLALSFALPLLAESGELKKGMDQYWNGDFSDAVETLKGFLKHAELRYDMLTARKYLAFAYVRVKETDHAKDQFRKILSIDPTYAITTAEAAPSTLRLWQQIKGEQQKALKEKKRKKEAERKFEEAKQLYTRDQLAAARRLFLDVLKLDPSNQFAPAYLSQIQAKQRIAESRPQAEVVTASPIEKEPETPPTQAAATPPPRTSTSSNLAVRYNDRGLRSFREGNYQSALSSFQRAVEEQPSQPMFHFNLGLAHDRLHHTEQAVAAYRDAIRIDPEGFKPRAHRQIGLVYFRRHAWIKAARELEEALQAGSDDPDTRRYLAQAYEQAHNLDKAIAGMTVLLQEQPNNADDHYALGSLHRKAGNSGAAAAEYREVLRIDPGYPQSAVIRAFLSAMSTP